MKMLNTFRNCFSSVLYFWLVSVCVICLGAKVKRIGNMATAERKTNKLLLRKKLKCSLAEKLRGLQVGPR